MKVENEGKSLASADAIRFMVSYKKSKIEPKVQITLNSRWLEPDLI